MMKRKRSTIASASFEEEARHSVESVEAAQISKNRLSLPVAENHGSRCMGLGNSFSERRVTLQPRLSISNKPVKRPLNFIETSSIRENIIYENF